MLENIDIKINNQMLTIISELSKLTGTNINTIKKHLANLVENNYLIKHGKTRGVWYTKA